MIRRSLYAFVFVLAACAFSYSYSLAQPPGGGPRGGPGAGGPRGGGAGGGGRSGGVGSPDAAFAQRLATLDEDKDGGLSIKELPEHMQQYFAASDGNSDGQLKGDEIKSLASHFGRDRMKPNGESDANSGSPGAPATEGLVARAGPGDGRPGGGPAMRGGPSAATTSPADLVALAFTFDANKDEALDKDELFKFAEELIARRRPVQIVPGAGRGMGGPAGGRGGPPAGNRLGRPQPE